VPEELFPEIQSTRKQKVIMAENADALLSQASGVHITYGNCRNLF
jgi:hypothetical protein